MSDVHHFTHGLLTPVLALVAAVIGVFIGLLCMAKARAVPSRRAKALWVATASVAIGGNGIWVMHFIAMLGFAVSALEMRYSLPYTLLSAAAGLLAVGAALSLTTFGPDRWWTPVLGVAILGSGAVGTHYIGMAATRLPAHYHYKAPLVLLSFLIALAAAAALIWYTRWVESAWAALGAAAIAGAAVTGMHYTAMAALVLHGHGEHGAPDGVRLIHILPTFLVGISIVGVVLIGIIALAPSDEELRADAELEGRLRGDLAEARTREGEQG